MCLIACMFIIHSYALEYLSAAPLLVRRQGCLFMLCSDHSGVPVNDSFRLSLGQHANCNCSCGKIFLKIVRVGAQQYESGSRSKQIWTPRVT